MNICRFLQMLVLFGFSSFGYAAETRFVNLVPADGVHFQVPAEERTYVIGGQLLATAKGQAPVPVTVENVETFFKKPIDSAEKAMELCQLLHWGALVENKGAFERVLALYREKGFAFGGAAEWVTTAETNLVRLHDGDMVFEPLTQKIPKGFEVAFTACVLHYGIMGGWVTITRYQYTIARNGRVVQKKADDYLEGPLLSWQVSATYRDSPEAEVAIQKPFQRRKELITGIYAICPNLIPAGIYAKASGR